MLAIRFRQDADKWDKIRMSWFRSKRILLFQLDKITALAERNLRFKRQLAAQFRKKLCARARFSNDKCPCGADIHNVVSTQFRCKRAWAKRPVPSNIDSAEEDNQSHTAAIGFRALPNYLLKGLHSQPERKNLCHQPAH